MKDGADGVWFFENASAKLEGPFLRKATHILDHYIWNYFVALVALGSIILQAIQTPHKSNTREKEFGNNIYIMFTMIQRITSFHQMFWNVFLRHFLLSNWFFKYL